MNFMLPEVAHASVDVIRRLGGRVTVAANGCCGLPAHTYGDLDAAPLEELVGFEQFRRLVPFGVKDILAEGREGQTLYKFCHPLAAEREFPVEGHRVGLQPVHHVDHVLRLRVVAGVGAVPGVAAVEQQRIGAGGAREGDFTQVYLRAVLLVLSAWLTVIGAALAFLGFQETKVQRPGLKPELP